MKKHITIFISDIHIDFSGFTFPKYLFDDLYNLESGEQVGYLHIYNNYSITQASLHSSS